MAMNIEQISIIGTGILGTQIAMLATYAGQNVRVYDLVEGAFTVTYNRIYQDLRAKNVNPFIPWNRWQECKDAVTQVNSLEEALQGAGLILEAVLENLELKQKVFQEIARYAPAQSIVATTSSSLPVSKMEGDSGRPEYCMNIHFYFPMQGINIVDIMGGSETHPEVVAMCEQWVKTIGCIPLHVKKETLGFCFSSVWRAIKRQTLHLWEQGCVDFRDIDRAWMIFTGMKEGPFALMDQVGLDSVYDIELVYYRESRNPEDKPPDVLQEKIKRGELGVKSGKGFYTYPKPEFLRPDFLNPP